MLFRRSGVSFMPLMIASHLFERSAATMPSKPVFWNFTDMPSRFATAVPMSMSEPRFLPPCTNSSGG